MAMKNSSAFMRYIKYARLKRFDVNAPDGHANERHRRLVLTTLSNFASKFVMIFTSMISISLTANYLGRERFGMWSLLSSFAAMLVFSDLGIGNGLLTLLSKANGEDDRENAAKYVSSAFFILLFIACIIGLVFSLVYPHVSWARIFNVSSDLAVAESGPVISVFFFCFLLNMPLGIVQRIQMGYQEGFVNNFWLVIGNVGAFFSILILIFLKAGLPYLAFAFVGIPVLAQFVNGFVLFYRQRGWLIPKWSLFSFSSAKTIMQLGLLFFILQIATAIGFQSDQIVIAQYLGADMVAEYSIPNKLFSIGVTLLILVLSPLWPAYGEALARQDFNWSESMLKKSLIYSISFGSIFGILLLFISRSLLKIWVGEFVSPSWVLLGGFACWLILRSILAPLNIFMNGIGVIGFQTIIAVFATIANIIVSIGLAQKIGVAGPIWGSVLAVFFCILIPQILYVVWFIRNMRLKNGD